MEPTSSPQTSPEAVLGGTEFLEMLRQAFARQPVSLAEEGFVPLSLTVAISREAGSRGGTIGRRVGKKLGWQVYHQELLEYLAQEPYLSRGLFDVLDSAAAAWVEERVARLAEASQGEWRPEIRSLIRTILAIGARGEAVIIGRGAGCILPPSSTLHVRIVAPLADRVTYLSQLERLTREKAAEQVAARDSERAAFVAEQFGRQIQDVYQYDLVLNSSLLGEELCAELIARAARTKLESRGREGGASRSAIPELV
ncbi:MAG: cytidylate kinase-like family protein [Gemmatales bacterium]|nr:cytidylate kinase-like family protein [Gemmatales bacterium]MDW8388287.1 cytidylate kinase-like family protein [Gemmatales bacterium]